MTTISVFIDVAAAHCGSFYALATALGVSTSAPHMWKKRGAVPAEHCPRLAQLARCQRWELRPTDWHRIWPELIGADGAPPVPDQTESQQQAA